MPQVNIAINVDSQPSVGVANVYIDMDITRPSTNPTPPDHTWMFTDVNGHFHAYKADGTLPTLDAESNGNGPVYYCKVCRVSVTPAVLSTPADLPVTIHPPWGIRVTLNTVPVLERVVVRAQPAGQPIHFGIARVDKYTGTGPYVVDLVGEAPIAVMKP
jgi:hypothetical protein